MNRKWNEPDNVEKRFIESFLFIEGKSTRKEIEKKWCNSSHWNGKKSTATLHHSLMDLRKGGIVLTDNTNVALEFSLI